MPVKRIYWRGVVHAWAKRAGVPDGLHAGVREAGVTPRREELPWPGRGTSNALKLARREGASLALVSAGKEASVDIRPTGAVRRGVVPPGTCTTCWHIWEDLNTVMRGIEAVDGADDTTAEDPTDDRPERSPDEATTDVFEGAVERVDSVGEHAVPAQLGTATAALGEQASPPSFGGTPHAAEDVPCTLR